VQTQPHQRTVRKIRLAHQRWLVCDSKRKICEKGAVGFLIWEKENPALAKDDLERVAKPRHADIENAKAIAMPSFGPS
jgi:hypothetical protein